MDHLKKVRHYSINIELNKAVYTVEQCATAPGLLPFANVKCIDYCPEFMLHVLVFCMRTCIHTHTTHARVHTCMHTPFVPSNDDLGTV